MDCNGSALWEIQNIDFKFDFTDAPTLSGTNRLYRAIWVRSYATLNLVNVNVELSYIDNTLSHPTGVRSFNVTDYGVLAIYNVALKRNSLNLAETSLYNTWNTEIFTITNNSSVVLNGSNSVGDNPYFTIDGEFRVFLNAWTNGGFRYNPSGHKYVNPPSVADGAEDRTSVKYKYFLSSGGWADTNNSGPDFFFGEESDIETETYCWYR